MSIRTWVLWFKSQHFSTLDYQAHSIIYILIIKIDTSPIIKMLIIFNGCVIEGEKNGVLVLTDARLIGKLLVKV